MSVVQWVGCIEAMTPNSLNRFTSDGMTIWACSTRWRRSLAPNFFWARSMAFRTQLTPLSPMAWVPVW